MIGDIYELKKFEECKISCDIFLIDEWFKETWNTHVRPLHPRKDWQQKAYWQRIRSNPFRKNYH